MNGRFATGVIASLLYTAVTTLVVFSSPAVAGEPVGWRTDGTGNYPDSRPPGEIGPEVNVAWKTPMPDWSNASPILVEDRIFICSEPYDILCVDGDKGKILWTRSNGFHDLEDPGPEMSSKIQAEVDQDSMLVEQEKRVGKERAKLRKAAKADTGNAELKERVKAKGKELAGVKEKRDALLLAGKVRKWPTHRTNGYSSRTLASDGKHILGAFGNGMVVCYDLEGNLKWRVQHKPTFGGWGGSTSPALVRDRIIVHFDDHYVAHRISDGKELWRLEARLAYGTPVVTYLDGTALLVTPQGLLLDVERGEALGEPVFKALPYAAPVVKDGVIYVVGHKDSLCTAVQLPESVELLKAGGAKVLWTRGIKRDRYYGSPVVHDGLLYAFTRNHTLTVLDVKTGETLYAKRVPGLKGQGYMSPTVAGGRIYLNGEKGTLVAQQMGGDYVEAAPVIFGAFRSTPIFAENRMFLRTYENLFCFR